MAVLSSCDPSRAPVPDTSPSQAEAAWIVHLMVSDVNKAHLPKLQRAARVAEEQAGKVAGRPVRVVSTNLSTDALVALIEDRDVIGAVTAGGFIEITGSQDLIDSGSFPVVEIVDDLYTSGALTGSVFQASIPHPWQAFRLARYFGPDRGYRKVALAREPGVAGETAQAALAEALQLRRLAFVDAVGPVAEVVAAAERERVDAVVVEGTAPFIEQVAGRLGAEPTRYKGKAAIRQGWRPQLAGFDSLLDLGDVVPGTVAVSDYARAADARTPVQPVKDFRSAFGEDSSDLSLRVADAVRALALAVDKSRGADREGIVAELEKFDRVRFGHLPISLAPTDHVFAERDVLGLWTFENGGENAGWAHLMRTFTSDLERTNILEEDWPFFFDGTTPGGEAPFYHQAKFGSTARPDDDLH